MCTFYCLNLFGCNCVQLDLEMSFVEQHGIQTLVEETMAHLWSEILPGSELSLPFQRMPYVEAVDKVQYFSCNRSLLAVCVVY